MEATNNEFYGWIAALAAVMFGGSFGVPIKSKAARSVDIDPLVFQTYKTIVCFVTACLLVYTGIAPSLLNAQSIYAGLVSGLFWVPSGVGTIYAVKNVGLVLGIGLNATMIILVSFFWGVFVFGERVRSKLAASLAVSCMILGLIGTCYFFSANNDDDEEVGRRRRKSDAVSSSVITIVAKRIESSSGDDEESLSRRKCLPHHSSSSTTVRKRYNYNGGAAGHQSNFENNNNKTTNDFCAAIQRDDDDVESSSPSRKYYATTLASIDSFDTSTTTDSTTDGSTSSGGESDSEDDGANDKKKRDFSSLSSPRAPFSKNAENVSGGRVVRPQCPPASSSGVGLLSKRQSGILSALLAGISAGSMMAPMQWCDPDARGIGFLFSFAAGAAVITVSFWLLRYTYYVTICNLSPGEAWDELPSFHFRTMWLPGGLSGLLWSTGNLFGLLSIRYLGEGIGQPVTQTGLLVSGLWGIFYFKEVTGIKQIAGWFLCSFLTLLGILLLGYEHHMAAAAAAATQQANTHSQTHT